MVNKGRKKEMGTGEKVITAIGKARKEPLSIAREGTIKLADSEKTIFRIFYRINNFLMDGLKKVARKFIR
jgi:hypothetical protein